MNVRYFKYEFLRLFRNKRFFFFSLAFPLLLFICIGAANRTTTIDFGNLKLRFILVYMVAMAGYGAMIAAIGGGGRIASERAAGWNRQLRLTPLPPSTYFTAKILTSYVMSLLSIVVLFAAGLLFGVHAEAGRIGYMVGLILIGLLPLIALGVLIGHLLTPDSIGPALGGGAGFLAFVGGMWFPLQSGSTLEKIGELFPSYWIAQAARVGVGASGWPPKGWLVVAAWTVALSAAAARAYQRDTKRV